ncbi:MAG: YlxR family protein [Turicibacter sp.]|nr:YlxR family protein [Turicibacter sp.]
MNKQKENRIRKCVVTNERHPKEALLRVVRVDGQAVVDPTGVQEGRGAYVTADTQAIEKAKQKNAFARSLRMKVDEQIYDELLKRIQESCDE